MKQDLKRLIPLGITSFKDNYFTGTGVNWQGKAWTPGSLVTILVRILQNFEISKFRNFEE